MSTAALPPVQVGTAVLWVAAGGMPPSVLRIPDVVFDVGFPAVFAILFGAGLWTVATERNRNTALIVGTSLCAAFLAVAVALNILVPRSLPNF